MAIEMDEQEEMHAQVQGMVYAGVKGRRVYFLLRIDEDWEGDGLCLADGVARGLSGMILSWFRESLSGNGRKHLGV
jgi:hypothetical protein